MVDYAAVFDDETFARDTQHGLQVLRFIPSKLSPTLYSLKARYKYFWFDFQKTEIVAAIV